MKTDEARFIVGTLNWASHKLWCLHLWIFITLKKILTQKHVGPLFDCPSRRALHGFVGEILKAEQLPLCNYSSCSTGALSQEALQHVAGGPERMSRNKANCLEKNKLWSVSSRTNSLRVCSLENGKIIFFKIKDLMQVWQKQYARQKSARVTNELSHRYLRWTTGNQRREIWKQNTGECVWFMHQNIYILCKSFLSFAAGLCSSGRECPTEHRFPDKRPFYRGWRGALWDRSLRIVSRCQCVLAVGLYEKQIMWVSERETSSGTPVFVLVKERNRHKCFVIPSTLQSAVCRQLCRVNKGGRVSRRWCYCRVEFKWKLSISNTLPLLCEVQMKKVSETFFPLLFFA